jgi:hypothetical protein
MSEVFLNNVHSHLRIRLIKDDRRAYSVHFSFLIIGHIGI